MRVVAFVPVKGKSERIKNKNIRLLDGKELFLHTLEKLVSCSFIDEVFLDTESDEIIAIANEVGCSVLKRKAELASNSTDGNQLFMNEVKSTDADIYIQVLCTSPFIELDTISKGLVCLEENPSYDSVVLVKDEKQYTWTDGTSDYDINAIPNSIDLPSTIIETMGLYIIRKDAALKTQRRIGESPFMLIASPIEAVDVNWPEDFKLAELIAAGMREKSRKLLRNLKGMLSSPMLSDILDDLGYPDQIIKGITPNISHSKILGRAKTLKLRQLKEGENFNGIYRALNSYNSIVTDDIIVVENELSNYAYFGELNANLAVRAGAGGAIIGGKTRDETEVKGLGFPVFSTGNTCQDVKNRATTASINKTVNVFGVKVTPDSLIFADGEGVVVVPKEIESLVINEVVKKIEVEKRLLVDISLGLDVDEIIDKHGFF